MTGLLGLAIGLLALPSTAGAQAPGGLTQLSGADGCLVGPPFEGSGTGCTDVDGQGQGHGVAMSPDRKNVYLASTYVNTNFANNVIVFDRDPTTGVLTRQPGPAGCFAETVPGSGNAQCTNALIMTSPRGIVATNKAVYVAAGGSNGIAVFTRNETTGSLTQKAAPQGCIVENNAIGGEAGSCTDGQFLVSPQGLAVSPDGKHLYVASQGSDAVTTLGISGVNQSLFQIPNTCVQDVQPPGGFCNDGRALDGVFSVEVSPDGNRVYAGALNESAVSVYDRDPGSGALTSVAGALGCIDDAGGDGCTNLGAEMGQPHELALAGNGAHLYGAMGEQDRVLLFDTSAGGVTRRAGAAGCVSNTATTGCTTGRQLDYVYGLTLSPDERHLYAMGFNSSGVIELTRAGDGSLTPSSTARGCYSQGAAALCQTGNFIGNNRQAVVSPDGRFVYTVGDFSRLNVFMRDANPPVCQDGSATIGAGQSVVLNLPCTDDPGDPTEIAIVTPPNGGSVGSVDQAAKQVSFTAFAGFSGTTSFTFRATSNGVSSATKIFTVSITGTPPPLIRSTVTAKWLAFRRFTTVRGLLVKRLPARTKVVTTCKTRKKRLQKKRCPYKSKRVTSPTARAKLNLAKPFRKRKLPIGTKITITVTAPGFIGKVFSYTTRARARPAFKLQCLPPGATKPRKCA